APWRCPLSTAPTRDYGPAWTPELRHLLGSASAETVIADPVWPWLVAAVAACGWPPAICSPRPPHTCATSPNRTPTARRIRVAPHLPRRTAHPPRRHHRRRSSVRRSRRRSLRR